MPVGDIMDEFQKELLKSYILEKNLDKVRMILVNEPGLIDAENFFAAAKTGNLDIVKYLVEYSRISLDEHDANYRNVLHYAAESGKPEVFRYLVEKCGMDPLSGDRDLITPWDIVHDSTASAEKSDIEKYLEKLYGHRYEDFYRNPIRTGFFPDPSICRVGSDYYMVNSSFIYFPCIPISHSTDLVNWEIIGHAITDPKWSYLSDLEGGRGYWAPDISYYEGRFYITATYRLNDVPPVYRRQIVVSSDRPEGPYSEPVFIDEDGIDPSIFNDDDGRRYMLLNRGARIFELSKSADRKISDPQLLFYGDHKRAPEGPHLYKKDGWYYLLEAEGGTGPGHRVTVSRSKELFGNYEPCPYNPIMRQHDPDAPIQRCGHGDLVDTPDGRWYMVYLCGRMTGDGYSILGRETALDPVTWTADGWPIVNDLKGPSTMQVKPYPTHQTSSALQDSSDRISPCGLFIDYMTPRPFEEGGVICSLEAGSREFVIKGSRAPLSSIKSRNIVLRRQRDFGFRYEVTMDIPEMLQDQCAGITGYYDENTFLEFGVLSEDGELYVYYRQHIGAEDSVNVSFRPLPASVQRIRFCMETDRLKRDLSYSAVGSAEPGHEDTTSSEDSNMCPYTHFATLENVYYLCDEGLDRGKRFTGAMVGMYAYAGEKELSVRFSNDLYTKHISQSTNEETT